MDRRHKLQPGLLRSRSFVSCVSLRPHAAHLAQSTETFLSIATCGGDVCFKITDYTFRSYSLGAGETAASA